MRGRGSPSRFRASAGQGDRRDGGQPGPARRAGVSAGIGEHSAVVRGRVLARLGFGLTEDAEANAQHGRHTRGRISPDGPVLAMVVPTNEELLIARDTARLAAGG